jgi:hypothetical protein
MAYVTGIKKNASGTSATSTATDFSACNFLAALICFPANLTLSSFVDSSGNTWTQHASSPKTFTGTNAKAHVYYCVNPTVSATQTFTATISSADIIFLAVIGLSGRATSSAIDATNYAGDASAVTSHTGGATGSLASNGDDVIALFGDDNGTFAGGNYTYTAGSGWTLPVALVNSDGRTNMTGGIQYQANVASGSNLTGSWTSSSGTTGGAYVLAIKASSGISVAVKTANYYRRKRLSA